MISSAADKPEFSIAGAEWLIRPGTQRVFAALTATGHEARAVGGCVRDTLLARLDLQAGTAGPPKPENATADIDIATTSPPEETIKLAEKAGLRAVPTGLAHGTITVVSDATPYEVTTLRHDVETYGRHADVAFTDDWALDAARRDFTINALYADPDGSIFDPLNARPDLEARRVRFVGDPHQRIQEDYLRILRFFRFFARFGNGAPELDSLAACVSERAGLIQLSRERIGHEIMRLLVAKNAPTTVDVMSENGLLTQVLPVAPFPNRLREYTALEEIVPGLQRDPAMRLGALTVAVEENAARLQEALRLSNADYDVLVFWANTIRATQARPKNSRQMHPERNLKSLLYRLGRRNYQRRLLIDACLSPGRTDAETLRRGLHLPDLWPVPEFPLSGKDLIAIGVPAGPAVGEWLATIENEWLASGFALTGDELRRRVAERLTLDRK